jgi:hypothetical protein
MQCLGVLNPERVLLFSKSKELGQALTAFGLVPLLDEVVNLRLVGLTSENFLHETHVTSLSYIDLAAFESLLYHSATDRIEDAQVMSAPVEYLDLSVQGVPGIEARGLLVSPNLLARHDLPYFESVQVARSWTGLAGHILLRGQSLPQFLKLCPQIVQ